MLEVPKCYIRKCKYYIGVSQPYNTERVELNICAAFPDGIPYEISYGTDSHTTIRKDQNGDFVFTKALTLKEDTKEKNKSP